MVRKLCHNRWLAATTVVAVALVPVAAPLARDHGPPPVHAEARPDYAIAKKRLDTLFDGLPKLRMSFDTRDIDVGARARALGPDVDASFAFVRDRIAYQPYRGTLRFALGTLMSRAGNSCDQAALLGALLRRHHRRVRYAVGVLDTATARRLVGMTDQPGWRPAGQAAPAPSRERIAALAGLGFSKDRIAAIAARDRKAAAAVFPISAAPKCFTLPDRGSPEIRRHVAEGRRVRREPDRGGGPPALLGGGRAGRQVGRPRPSFRTPSPASTLPTRNRPPTRCRRPWPTASPSPCASNNAPARR